MKQTGFFIQDWGAGPWKQAQDGGWGDWSSWAPCCQGNCAMLM